MILNSRGSSFTFHFPRGFFSDKVEEKYMPYVKRLPQAYHDLKAYMSAQVQSVTVPSLSMETVSQTRVFGKQQEYKSAKPDADLFSRDFTITMKTLDGYINYWIFLENALEYLALFEDNETYMEPLKIVYIDKDGRAIMSQQFKGLVLTGISELQMSYTLNTPEFKTFDATFRMHRMELKLEND